MTGALLDTIMFSIGVALVTAGAALLLGWAGILVCFGALLIWVALIRVD